MTLLADDIESDLIENVIDKDSELSLNKESIEQHQLDIVEAEERVPSYPVGKKTILEKIRRSQKSGRLRTPRLPSSLCPSLLLQCGSRFWVKQAKIGLLGGADYPLRWVLLRFHLQSNV